MSVEVKICGLKNPAATDAAVKAGADLVGLNFFPKSPRYVTPQEAAALASMVANRVIRTGLFVNPETTQLERILTDVPLDLLQLHGDEPPDRVAEIRSRFGLPVMKVIKVTEEADLAAVKNYEEVADRIMFEPKTPKGADRPGGNAVAFDWTILQGFRSEKPWMLAGGLTPDNVATAIWLTGAPGVDTASGVEDAPGVKNEQKMRQFVEAARKR